MDKHTIQQLYLAGADSGSLDVVKNCIGQGVPIDACDRYDTPALLKAVFNGHHKVAEYILSHGANVDLQNNAGTSALMYAAFKGDLEMIELLVSYKADLELQNGYEHTALMSAIQCDHLEAVKLLLTKGANPDTQSAGSDVTAMMFALEFGRTKIVKHLIQWGADTSLKDHRGQTMLDYAYNYGQSHSRGEKYRAEFEREIEAVKKRKLKHAFDRSRSKLKKNMTNKSQPLKLRRRNPKK